MNILNEITNMANNLQYSKNVIIVSLIKLVTL